MMKIIVGLGNPGTKYAHSRHNTGFLAVDFLREHNSFSNFEEQPRFQAAIAEGSLRDSKALLIKPLTFMNLSGQVLKAICDFYKIDTENELFVIHDDVDLPFGRLKTVSGDSAAGHKGVKSVIASIGHENFWRFRVGIETRSEKTVPATEDYVLGQLSDVEIQALQKVFEEINRELLDPEGFVKEK